MKYSETINNISHHAVHLNALYICYIAIDRMVFSYATHYKHSSPPLYNSTNATPFHLLPMYHCTYVYRLDTAMLYPHRVCGHLMIIYVTRKLLTCANLQPAGM